MGNCVLTTCHRVLHFTLFDGYRDVVSGLAPLSGPFTLIYINPTEAPWLITNPTISQRFLGRYMWHHRQVFWFPSNLCRCACSACVCVYVGATHVSNELDPCALGVQTEFGPVSEGSFTHTFVSKKGDFPPVLLFGYVTGPGHCCCGPSMPAACEPCELSRCQESSYRSRWGLFWAALSHEFLGVEFGTFRSGRTSFLPC